MFKSATYLLLTRVTQLGFPLILYPFLVKVLGVDKLGEIVFWHSVTAFLGVVASLNMETFAARVLVTNPEDHGALAAPVIIKGVIALIVITFWVLFATFYSETRAEWVVMVASVHAILLTTLTPNFYFISKSDFALQFIAIFFEKALNLIFILLFVTRDKYYYVPVIYLFSVMMSCFLSLYVIKVRHKLDISEISYKDLNVKSYLSVSMFFLVGKLTQLHTNLAKFFVGVFFDFSAVTLFDVCEKIINMAKIPFTMISQIAFSRLSGRLFELGILFIMMFSISFLFYFSLNYYGGFLFSFFIGGESQLMINLLGSMSVIILFMPFLLVIGVNYLARFCNKKIYPSIQMLSNLISILMLCLFSYFFYRKSELGLDLITFSYWVVLSEGVFSFFCFFVFIFVIVKGHKG